jgi:hypothetical protein
MLFSRALIALALTPLAYAAYYTARRVSRERGWVALLLLAVPVLSVPLLIPGDERIIRFLFALLSAMVVFKLLDLQHPRSSLPDLRSYVEFAANPTILVWRKLRSEPRFNVRRNLVALVLGSAGVILGGLGLQLVSEAHLSRFGFAVEHTVKLLVFYVVVLGAVEVVEALWRLLVGPARDTMHNIYLATTPADFWRRYNRMVGQFFAEDLFKRAGGLRAPVRATLIVFAASSLLHEYVFGIAIGAVQGYQTAFFMLQGLGVAATLRVRPEGWARIPWTAATMAFNISSGVLFFTSIQQLFPFWSAPPFSP